MSVTGTTRDKPKFLRDRKKLISQTDMRNIKPLDDKLSLASPKMMNYAFSTTQKSSPTKKLSFGVTSPKNFYPQYRKDGPESRHAYTRSDTLKVSTTRLDSKSFKEHVATEGIAKIDQAFGSVSQILSSTGHQNSKNLPSSPKKSLKTESVDAKGDVLEKALSPKAEDKYKTAKPSEQAKQSESSPKHNEVLKQIEAHMQLQKRIKKPAQLTKSVALPNNFKDSSIISDSKISETPSHRRSISNKDIPWEKLDFPVRPELVLERYSHNLAPHEKEEILNYQEIYYISDLDHKLPAKSQLECDDERGDYIVIRNDHIQYRYEILEMLGRGSFGQVIKVLDHKTKEQVALKIIRSPKKFHLQAKIEVKILRYMMQNRGADFNITELKSFFVFRNHVCLVFDLMSLNLYDFLKKNKFKGFSLSVIRKFAIQILYALKFLSHHKIIHCDLKPENILLKQLNKTGVKLIDFGSSCFENEKLYTYIQSRFYRSPEIILGLSYTSQIDMWSFGCLLCELYLGYPIFAGDSEHDQLLAMMEVLGPPEQRLILNSPKKAKFFEEDLSPKIVPNTKGRIRTPSTVPLESILNCEDDSFVDLIRSCLIYDPNQRYSPTDALGHEWILKGLPVELKVQHMQLLEKSSAVASTRTGFSTSKDRSNTIEQKEVQETVPYKQEKVSSENVQRTKHKKTISESIHRSDLFKSEEKTIPSFHSKKKSTFSITHVGEEDSMGNITLNLNESKQSIGTSKLYSGTKLNSLASPMVSTTKEKLSTVNNFFPINKSKPLSSAIKAHETISTPKRTQTVRDGTEEEVAISGIKSTHTSEFKIQKVSKRALSQKSLSMEKKLSSPKVSESLVKAYNPSEANGALSAPRTSGFPTLKSPVAKKK